MWRKFEQQVVSELPESHLSSVHGKAEFDKCIVETQFLLDCGLFETETLLVVADPCDDVGSAGSALNALLTTGTPGESLPLGAGFLPSSKIAECPWIMPDYPIVHTIRNVNVLATNCDYGVWICGTDTLWKLPGNPNKFSLKPDEISAFCFEGDCQQTLSHGTYQVDDEIVELPLSICRR
ncbi:unnamed protein product [Haemonchus placei]|uniref:CN hydrolase domain-containing protein n=1 Tax=Haemonchus placei TaxID=6290 RepID=A0A0N4VVQ9_HAEPC|nr:unnamed protein product [Haemonchus placei]